MTSVEAAPTVAAPSVADGVEHQLDPRYVRMSRQTGSISALIFGGAILALGIVIVWAGDMPRWANRLAIGAGAMFLVARLAWALIRPALAYRFARYRLDAYGIEIR